MGAFILPLAWPACTHAQSRVMQHMARVCAPLEGAGHGRELLLHALVHSALLGQLVLQVGAMPPAGAASLTHA